MADQNIALGVQVPDSFKSISGLLNFAGQAQQLRNAQQEYERGGVALERERRTLEPTVSEAETRASKAKQALPLEIARLQADSETARTGADAASLALQTRNADLARNTVAALVTNPAFIAGSPEARHHILDSTEAYLNSQGLKTQPGGALEQTRKLVDSNVSPQDMTAHMQQFIQQGATSSEKSGMLNASPALVNNNQQVVPVGTNPYNAGNPAGVPAVQQQVPVTQPTFNSATQTPGIVGPQPGVSPVPVQPAAAAAPIQTGPALGVAETAGGLARGAIEDYVAVQNSARNASQDIGVLQEIKKYAPGAATGVLNDRRAFISGLAGLIGMDVGELEKTKTDLLAKNANMLALAGGDTNLAKTLAETANPNVHMTREAIEKAANQVIAQRQLALARQKFLQPFVSDPNRYQQAVAEFNQIADPRILQLPSMNLQEKADMKKAMSPQEQRAFGEKVRKMQQLGILQ
jgi:hypothetical protein